MSFRGNIDIDNLDLSDSDPDALFDSPPSLKQKAKSQSKNLAESSNNPSVSASKAKSAESRFDTEETREAALQRELESVRNVNRVIEDVVASLEKAKSNMGVSLWT